MAKTKISEWDSNPNNNTDIDSINIAEGCAPSGINNAIRELMSQVKDLYAGTSGDTLAVAGGGTGSGTAAGARTNLGLGSMATQADTSVDINGGNIDGTAIGASSASTGAFTTLSATGTTTLTTVDINGGNIDGTAIGASSASTGAFTTLSASGNVTLSGGTANGVAYLNGSKVLTTGSALTFDGTNLGIGTSSPSSRLSLHDPSGGDVPRIRFTNGSTGTGASDGMFIGVSNSTQLDIWNFEANAIRFGTGGTERMRIDSSGNLGLGVTPSGWSGVAPVFEIGSSVGTAALFQNGVDDLWFVSNTYFNGSNWIYKKTGTATQYHMYAGKHIWFTAPSGTAGNTISFTQAMTLDASGTLLVGTTSLTGVSGVGASFKADSNGRRLLQLGTSTTATNILVEFFNPNGAVGKIETSASATVYSTSSDYRLKENIQPMTGALAKVAALKPCTYKWKADGSDGEGFIAHELAEVVPQAVTGEKDAVDAEGKPVYQGIDTSFLVATLTAAIQEQQAQIEQLRAEIQTLKGN